MNAKDLQQIIDHRDKIVASLGGTIINQQATLMNCIEDTKNLGRLINKWIMISAEQYRSVGLDIHEWYGDIMEWFKNNKFLMVEVERELVADNREQVTLHCHLYPEGPAKNLVLKIRVIK